MDKARVAVVGAGVTGLSISIALLRNGMGVTLFDQSCPPAGASRAANGAITPYSDTTLKPPVKSFAEETLTEYPEYVKWLTSVSQLAIDYDEGGVLQLFLPEDELVFSDYAHLLSNEVSLHVLSASEARRYSPEISPDVVGAILYATETRLDVLQLLEAMNRAFLRLGGVTSIPSAVAHVSQSSDDRVTIRTAWGTSTYDWVVVAVGGGQLLIDDAPLCTVSRIRGEILELRTPPGSIRHCLYRGDAFLTPRRDGRLLAGTTYTPHVDGMDECPDTVNVEGAAAILSAMSRMLPSSRHYEISRFWKGWRPTSVDGVPLIGKIVDSNVWMVDGLGGLGYTLAIAISKRVAEAIDSGISPSDLQPFSPYRFRA